MYSATILAVFCFSAVLALPPDSATSTTSGRQCRGGNCPTSTAPSRFIPTSTTTSRTPMPRPTPQDISKLVVDMHNELRRNAGQNLQDLTWNEYGVSSAEWAAETCDTRTWAWHPMYPDEVIAASRIRCLRDNLETNIRTQKIRRSGGQTATLAMRSIFGHRSSPSFR